MTLVQCLDLQLILTAIFVIPLIVLMEQIAEYFYFKKDKRMKIKIISQPIPKFFNGYPLPSFTDKSKYFIMYKKTLVAEIQIPGGSFYSTNEVR